MPRTHLQNVMGWAKEDKKLIHKERTGIRFSSFFINHTATASPRHGKEKTRS
jgi:hypothetical protein